VTDLGMWAASPTAVYDAALSFTGVLPEATVIGAPVLGMELCALAALMRLPKASNNSLPLMRS
jgi:hypothetical protein